MKQITLAKAYLIYALSCISIIALYLYSTILREYAEILGRLRPFISQYYNLETVAVIGFGLNLSYFLHFRKSNYKLALFHLVLAILLLIFALFGVINMNFRFIESTR